MSELPVLSSSLLRQELKRFYRDRRKHYMVAVYGTGLEEELSATWSQPSPSTVKVIPVASELELRQRMPPLEEELPQVVFLVPFTRDLPLDLAGRFAQNGRVMRFGPERQLAALCGADTASSEVSSSALGQYLLTRPSGRKEYRCDESTLTLRGLWNVFLHEEFGVPVEGGLGRDTFVAWVGTTPVPTAAIELFEQKPLLEELEARLRESLGELEVLLFGTWLRGDGPKALQLATIFEILTTKEDEAVTMWLHERVVQLFGSSHAQDSETYARALGRAAAPARKWLARQQGNERLLQELYVAAEAHVTHPKVRKALCDSTVLPSAWDERLGQLGDALLQGSEETTVSRAQTAVHAFRALASHERFASTDLTVAEMALRLLVWLAGNPLQQLQSGLALHADTEQLSRWYAEQGGYVDWARLRARSSADSRLGVGIQAVVEQADALRSELDQRFATSLAHWVASDRPGKATLPIDQALERLALTFLSQDDTNQRRLLVILMDGMAWAQAVQLLESLEHGLDHWGVLAWHGEVGNRIGGGTYPPMLANLPTVTEVSRSAFFMGRTWKDGEPLSASEDPKRFEGNKRLHPFCTTSAAPRLLLKSEGHAQSGVATSEALSLIDDKQRRIISIVINAIDSSLDADSQQQQNWDTDSIKSLPTLLERAKLAGRFVMFVSDHGHVPSVRFKKTLPTQQSGGQRWRPWLGDADSLRPGEMKLRGKGVYCPKNVSELVVLTQDDLTYSSSPCAGQHGGATLAEVVAPCLLLGPDAELAHGWTGESLPLRPRFVPDWWSLSLPASNAATRTAPPPKRSPKLAPPEQTELPGMPLPEVKSPGPEPAYLSPLHQRLLTNKLLRSQAGDKPALLREVVATVTFLLERGGTVPIEALAQPLSLPSFRVRGKLPQLQFVLNLDGYGILQVDDNTKQVSFNREMFAQQFEVTL